MSAFALALAGCLDVHETPKRTTDVGVAAIGDDASSSDSGDADSPAFEAGACIGACIAATPAGRTLFEAVSNCTVQGRTRECADQCAPGATSTASTTCGAPIIISDIPSCNVCIKNLCCAKMLECAGNAACIELGLCARQCQ